MRIVGGFIYKFTLRLVIFSEKYSAYISCGKTYKIV